MKITSIGKLLAIFVAVASVSFLGVVIATVFGGPSWQDVMAQKEFRGYRIEKSSGPDAQWSATRARDEGNVGTSKVLPDVLTKVMDDVIQARNQRVQDLQARIPNLEQKIARIKDAIEKDDAALQAYIDQEMARLAEVRKNEQEQAALVIAATNDAQKLENQIVNRREDVFRLQEQVSELKIDLFRLEGIRDGLVHSLNQVQGNLELATERQKRLDYSPAAPQ